MTISNIQLQGDNVNFTIGTTLYIYMITRGRLYLGDFGTPIHQSDMGSFEISENRSIDEIRSHAQLLGARVREA